MKYAILRPQYCLRGWIGLPYTLVCDGSVIPISREEFNILILCDGKKDLYSFHSQKIIKALSSLEEKGFVLMSSTSGELNPEQYYRYYNNRYIHDFYWSITGKCNFKCRHCFIDAPDASMGEMSHDEAIHIIDQIAECGVYHLLISGGEPFVRKDFWSLIDYALKKKIQIDQVYTNGWMLSDSYLDEFVSRGMNPEFIISFDGVGWHDWMRGVNGAEKVTLDALQRCSKRGFSTNVEMCIHRGNMNAIRESINLLAKIGINSVKCSEVSYSDLWKKNAQGNDITTEEYFDAVLRYIPMFYKDGMPINILFGGVVNFQKNSTEYWAAAEFDKGSEECLNRYICGSVRSSCYIAPDGRLLPCMPVASVPDQSMFPKAQEIGIQNALRDSYLTEFANYRVKDLLNICKTCRECPFHLKCGGGCRAYAVMEGEHNLMGPDPSRCLMWKGGYLQKLHEVCDQAIVKYCNTNNEY